MRLDLETEAARLAAALRRELGEASPGLRQVAEGLQPLWPLIENGTCLPRRGFWERREISKQRKKRPKSSVLAPSLD